MFRDGVIEQGKIGALAIGVGFSRFGVAGGVKERRLDVRGAAREDDRVESTRFFAQLRWREAKRDFDGFGAGGANRG